MANRSECFSDFSKQQTAKERWHSLVSRMGDGEEYLKTTLGLMGYQFFLPMVLRLRALRAQAPLLVRWFQEKKSLPTGRKH